MSYHEFSTVTPSTYGAACNVVQELARRGNNFWSLDNRNINPFFVIYACADCNIPLPDDIKRQLLWKHLDAILRAKCWRGLGSSRAKTLHHSGADAGHFPPKFVLKGDDPDNILQSLLNLSYRQSRSDPEPAPVADDVPRPVHGLKINIKDYKWVAEAQVGKVWYQAGDLVDDDDIACFAVIDSLTRLLPCCRGGILEICSGDIRLLWGVGGAPSGAWSVVHAVCTGYQVRLRGKWSERGPDPCDWIDPAEGTTVLPRDRDVVDAVVNEFMQMQLDDKAAYRCMMAHLQITT